MMTHRAVNNHGWPSVNTIMIHNPWKELRRLFLCPSAEFGTLVATLELVILARQSREPGLGRLAK